MNQKANGIHENIKCKKPLGLVGKIHGIEQNKKRKPNFTVDNCITAHSGIISISLLNCRIKLRRSFALNGFIFFIFTDYSSNRFLF